MTSSKVYDDVNERKKSASRGSSNAVGWYDQKIAREFGLKPIAKNVYTSDFQSKRSKRVQKVTQRNRKPVAYAMRDLKANKSEVHSKVAKTKQEVNEIDLQIKTIESAPLPLPKPTGRYYGKGIPVMSYNDVDNATANRAKQILPLQNQRQQKESELAELQAELEDQRKEEQTYKELQKQEYVNMTGDQTLEGTRRRSALSNTHSRTRPRKNILTVRDNQNKFKALGV